MRKIWKYLKEFIQKDWNPWLYGIFFLVAGLLLYLNYAHGLENTLINDYRTQAQQLPRYFFYYFVPWALILAIWTRVHHKTEVWRDWRFWATAIFGFCLLALNSWFWQYRLLAEKYFEPRVQQYWVLIFWNLKRYFFYFFLLFLFWLAFDRKHSRFYGLTTQNFDLRPYFLMLAIMLPLIFLASYTEGFQHSYPQFTRMFRSGGEYIQIDYVMRTAQHYETSGYLTGGFFELAYGLDFASVELFFRGFLVIGMVRYLGRGAVLPMAMAYCILHFGKPAGEAVSSIFGGYILGVIAYYSRSIFGGIIVHMGIAWLMELFASLHLYGVL